MAVVKLTILALALMLIFEGIMPFAAPLQWRAVMERLLACHDGQLRFIGAISMGVGLVLFLVTLLW